MLLNKLIKLLVVFLAIFLMSLNAFGKSDIKKPNVNGQFYDSNPKRLSEQIDFFIQNAAPFLFMFIRILYYFRVVA